MEETQQLVSEVQQIIHQYKSEVTGKRKQWPRAVKERVKKLWEHGMSSHKISQLVDIPYVTLNSWEKTLKGQFKPVKVKSAEPVNPDLTAKALTARPSTAEPLTVKTPNGFEIKGLSFNQVQELIQGDLA